MLLTSNMGSNEKAMVRYKLQKLNKAYQIAAKSKINAKRPETTNGTIIYLAKHN